MNLAPVAAACHRRPLVILFVILILPPRFMAHQQVSFDKVASHAPCLLWSAVGRPLGRPTAFQGRRASEVHSVRPFQGGTAPAERASSRTPYVPVHGPSAPHSRSGRLA